MKRKLARRTEHSLYTQEGKEDHEYISESIGTARFTHRSHEFDAAQARPGLASDDDLDCEKIRSRSLSSLIICPPGTPFEGQALCTQGNLRGDLRGTFLFIGLNFAPSAGMPESLPPDTISSTGEGTITTEDGTLTFLDTGIADFDLEGDGAFSDFARVTGGTGEFAGATGTLFLHGFFNEDKTGFRTKWRGEVCVPDDD